MQQDSDIVEHMKLFHQSRKLVYDTETKEIQTFEEFEKQQEKKENE